MRLRLGLVSAIAIVSLSAVATAGAVVPPGNSAVNQYTETYPTAGGNTPTDRGGGQTPAQALGKENARKLEAMGPEGTAAARLAGETAPAGGAEGSAGGDQASGGTPGGGGNVATPDGSSGISEVIGSATGSSNSGELGLALPLIILATLLGSGFYAWHRRTT